MFIAKAWQRKTWLCCSMGFLAVVTANTNKAELLDVFLVSSPTRSPRPLCVVKAFEEARNYQQ